MLKFLLLAVLVLWLLYSPWVRQLLRGKPASKPHRPEGQPDPGSGRPAAMVPCAHCGLHLPASEAIVNEAGQPFCSEAHRRAGPGRA